MTDIIAIAVILLVVGAALGYIIWAKKKGRRCIGCPDSKGCSGNCSSCQGNCKTK
ncbi:MAG: FeoB-associated Cys-rich membrane protein [Clostridia bacterium]|nr:FeoB-associated Cys-rich membrane protein [Clostridia bacterium]MBR3681321.1 FeoB-associated Cys-rich membrane protein [Clostridia bacterium]